MANERPSSQKKSIIDSERVPPHNLDAEKSLLGSALIDQDAMLKISDIVTEHDFYKNAHRYIFGCMSELYAKGEPIDILTINTSLEEKGLTEKVGGRSYLASLTNSVPTAAHVVQYANIVSKKATLRKLLAAASEITSLSYQEEHEIESLLDQAQQQLYGVTQRHLTKAFTDIKQVLHGAFDRIDELHREKGKLRGVSSGFKKLDDLLAGFQKSDLVILAARPAVGKTSLALDFARAAATKGKVPVGMFSLEMSKEQLVDRMLCAEAGVDLWKLRTGNLSDRPDSDDFPRIGRAMGVLSEAPIYIDDTPGNTVLQIRTKARRLQAEHGLGLLVIDYLQLLAGSGKSGDNRVQEVTQITTGLKALAKELNVPIMALSQLSRQVESRDDKRPQLSDLRESGSIEQDADVVMFVFREEYYVSRREPTEGTPEHLQWQEEMERVHGLAECIIGKQRHGPTGTVKLQFQAEVTRFSDLDQVHTEGFE